MERREEGGQWERGEMKGREEEDERAMAEERLELCKWK